jgi:predicted nucleotidyltransferase
VTNEDLVQRVAAALAPLSAVRGAWVFGSQLAGAARPDSDLDVGLLLAPELDAYGRHRARLDVVGALTDALGPLGERSDPVDLMRCDSAVAFAAIRFGRLALERAKAERVEAIVRICRRYEDDAPRRRLFERAAQRWAGAAR